MAEWVFRRGWSRNIELADPQLPVRIRLQRHWMREGTPSGGQGEQVVRSRGNLDESTELRLRRTASGCSGNSLFSPSKLRVRRDDREVPVFLFSP